MKKSFKPVDLQKVRTGSLKDRKSLVKRDKLGSPCTASASFGEFLDSLPGILAANDFREIVQRLARARRDKRVIIWGMGAHVIKVGLSAVLIDLMEQGFISCVALNGAGVIHDVEMAMTGSTSEDVATELESGDFGMSGETASFINGAVARGVKAGYGLGESVGRALLASKFPYVKESIIAAACSRNIPVTVHVAMGTDIIHMHPSCDGAAFGEGSHRDFRLAHRCGRQPSGRGIPERGLLGHPAGSFFESSECGAKPRQYGEQLYHGDHGFYPALPAHDQCGATAGHERRERVCPGRAPRDHGAAPGCGPEAGISDGTNH